MCFRLWVLGLGFWVITLFSSSIFASSFGNFHNITADVSSIIEFESKLFYSSKDKLYCLDDGKIKKIYDIRGDEFIINRLVSIDNDLYICAENGLYLYDRNKIAFERIWHKSSEENVIASYDIVLHKDKFYLATSRGLYESSNLFSFHKSSVLRDDILIKRLIIDGNSNLLILATSAIYSYDSKSIKKLYDIGLDTDKKLVDTISMNEIIYVASYKGLYYLESGILKPVDIKLLGFPVSVLHVFDKQLYVGSKKGLFVYSIEQEDVRRINGSLGLKSINDIDVLEQNLILACSDGIFIENNNSLASSNSFNKLKYGPGIKELHRVVMKYNEISPNKIRNWRRRLKARALMPDLSVSYDKTMYGTAGTGSYDGKVYVGPNDWGVSMSWDLGNLVFDDDETTIDNRSRLNTQQRVDMLEEISRIYFERKRSVFKYNNSLDNPEKQFELLLLIEELTASLDAYSGGWFSENL